MNNQPPIIKDIERVIQSIGKRGEVVSRGEVVLAGTPTASNDDIVTL